MERLKLLMGDDEVYIKPDPPPAVADVETLQPEEKSAEQLQDAQDRQATDELIGARDAGPRLQKVSQGPKLIVPDYDLNAPLPQQRATKTPFVKFRLDGEKPALGAEANEQDVFCPFQALRKWPYRFLEKDDQDKVSGAFYIQNKFFEREWDIYYINPPPSMNARTLLLLPGSQVNRFFEQMSTTLNMELKPPAKSEEMGFLVKFAHPLTPHPRYLGRSDSRESFEHLEGTVPSYDFSDDVEAKAPKEALKAFMETIELAMQAQRSKNKGGKAKAKKQEQQTRSLQTWGQQLERAQCYLGLYQRSNLEQTSTFHGAGTEATGETSVEKPRSEAAGPPIQSMVDVHLPAPFAPDSSVVFVAIDVEAAERNHSQITEIGITTLDTRDLVGQPPGEGCKTWMTKIRPRHFRIKEYGHIVNTEFIRGCPEYFEFGQSEWISLQDAPAVVASCFKHPFSAAVDVPTPETNIDTPTTTAPPDESAEKRTIILLGHDITADLTYLRTVGYDPFTLPNLLEVLDTSTLYRSLKQEPNIASLGTVLYELGIMGWHLHNAGNDAVYTMQSMLAICLRDLVEKGRKRGPEVVHAKIGGGGAEVGKGREEGVEGAARSEVVVEKKDMPAVEEVRDDVVSDIPAPPTDWPYEDMEAQGPEEGGKGKTG
ncbi:MAG: hypothetical protein M1817_004842 [Caeruleum heppii]|nr:MAG: hypothetical protein M1817_004842 [Caeruleum heppii]